MSKPFDLLTTVEYGGCSAKIPAGLLSEMLKDLPLAKDPRLLVDVDTHDDAGVYLINEETALIFTTDFFPPICSDAYEFGEIAASNALSDVYAMGGSPLLALNLMMFSHTKIPLEVFGEILKGGDSKVREAGALTVGGHTIDDHPPKFGLAVVGLVHPDQLITNAGARPGDRLVLTKTIGILVPYLADPFFAEIVRKIERLCIEAGYWPIVFSAHGRQSLENNALSTLRSQRPAGALIAPLGRSSDFESVRRFTEEVPTIVFDSNVAVGEAFVGSNNFQSIGLIVDYLCRTGEPPCFFEMPPVNPNANKRRDAYIQSMERLGHEPQVIRVGSGG